MSTNPIGKGTTNVTVNMPDDLKKQLAELAQASGSKSLGAYIKAILEDYSRDRAVIEPAKVVRRPKSSSSGAGKKKA